MRTPISCRRCDTREGQQPVDADTRQQQRHAGERAEHLHLDTA